MHRLNPHFSVQCECAFLCERQFRRTFICSTFIMHQQYMKYSTSNIALLLQYSYFLLVALFKFKVVWRGPRLFAHINELAKIIARTTSPSDDNCPSPTLYTLQLKAFQLKTSIRLTSCCNANLQWNKIIVRY